MINTFHLDWYQRKTKQTYQYNRFFLSASLYLAVWIWIYEFKFPLLVVHIIDNVLTWNYNIHSFKVLELFHFIAITLSNEYWFVSVKTSFISSISNLKMFFPTIFAFFLTRVRSKQYGWSVMNCPNCPNSLNFWCNCFFVVFRIPYDARYF